MFPCGNTAKVRTCFFMQYGTGQGEFPHGNTVQVRACFLMVTQYRLGRVSSR